MERGPMVFLATSTLFHCTDGVGLGSIPSESMKGNWIDIASFFCPEKGRRRKALRARVMSAEVVAVDRRLRDRA
jgi:hypothetical protein